LAKSKSGNASADKELKMLRRDIKGLAEALSVLLNHSSTIQGMMGRTNFALVEVAKSVEKIEFQLSHHPKLTKKKKRK